MRSLKKFRLNFQNTTTVPTQKMSNY